jgi:hypothetical protein
MRMPQHRRFRPSALLVLAVPPLASAGSVLELEMTEYYEDPPMVSGIEISTEGRSSRMEVTTEGKQESGGMIWRGDRSDMVAIDHDAREYYVLDRASVEAMAEQLGGAMKEMQEALESMPPEERALAEQMMEGHLLGNDGPPAPPATLHATGRDGSFGGYGCEYYEVRRGDVKVRELCVTSWDDLPDGRRLGAAMLEMAGFLDALATSFSEGAGLDVMGGQQEIFEHMRELDGYPVLTRELDESGRVTSETVLKSAAARKFDPDVFEPPAAYARRELGL